jgi:hypothetical protein
MNGHSATVHEHPFGGVRAANGDVRGVRHQVSVAPTRETVVQT